MDGNGLRERRPKMPDNDCNDDMHLHSEERKNEKTFGRTPDGTGKSIVKCCVSGRLELVSGFVTGKASQNEGGVQNLRFLENEFTTADIALQ